MEIERSLIKNVLKKMAEDGTEPKRSAPIIEFDKYYFYEARPENSIKFTGLKSILEGDSPEKEATIKRLQEGYSGKYCGDYFVWKKVVVATNRYSPDGSMVIYEADLTHLGALDLAGKESIYPSDSPVNADSFKNDIFTSKRGHSNIVLLDSSDRSFFINEDFSDNYIKQIQAKHRPSVDMLNYNDFTRIYDEYRVWCDNQLLLPNLDTPKNDSLMDGSRHYTGGESAYRKHIAPFEKGVKEEGKEVKTLGDMEEDRSEEIKEDIGSNIFKPVSEGVKKMANKILFKYAQSKEDGLEEKESAITQTNVGTYGGGSGGSSGGSSGGGSTSQSLQNKAKQYGDISNKAKETEKKLTDIANDLKKTGL